MSRNGKKMDVNGHKSKPLPNRKMLTAYLQYAVDDIAELDETSAMLVKVAISYLKKPQQARRQE